MRQGSGLKAKAEQARSRLSDCSLCPGRCGVDRTAGETGCCRTGVNAVVAGYDAHFGEEAQTSEMNRPITDEEYEAALKAAAKAGIKRFDPPRHAFMVF